MGDVPCSIVALVFELVIADGLLACLVDPLFEGLSVVPERGHSPAPLLLGELHACARWVVLCWLSVVGTAIRCLLLLLFMPIAKWLLLMMDGTAVRWL